MKSFITFLNIFGIIIILIFLCAVSYTVDQLAFSGKYTASFGLKIYGCDNCDRPIPKDYKILHNIIKDDYVVKYDGEYLHKGKYFIYKDRYDGTPLTDTCVAKCFIQQHIDQSIDLMKDYK